jgi:hypothetical protein
MLPTVHTQEDEDDSCTDRFLPILNHLYHVRLTNNADPSQLNVTFWSIVISGEEMFKTGTPFGRSESS